MAKFKWGILGPGNIAKQFAKGLQAIDDAEIYAVGSRSKERADAFADTFEIPVRYGSYEDLVKDPDLQGIYVASPHQMHMENSILCLEAGKPVICEKPFAVNATQTKAMIDCAKANSVFLMEAMWTRFLPVSRKIVELIKEGAIGDIQMLHCHFGFRAGWNPDGRLLNAAYAGGGLLDVGIYCVSYARMLFGTAPAETTGFAEIGETGVDEQAVFAFKYPTGKLAAMSTGVRTSTPHEATIMGTEGMIRVPKFWNAREYQLKDETHEVEAVGNGYNYQAVEMQECIAAGKLESDLLPLSESLEIMETLDKLRAQWGLSYPME